MTKQTSALEKRAKEIYEETRNNVSGRPPWEKLDPECEYSMGMKNWAIGEAEKEIGYHMETMIGAQQQ